MTPNFAFFICPYRPSQQPSNSCRYRSSLRPLIIPRASNTAQDGSFQYCSGVSSDPTILHHKTWLILKRTTSDMVNILVGEQETPFIMHKKILCSKSEYFAKAFEGEFRERDGVMRLPEDTPEAVSCFFDWIYTGKVDHSIVQDQESCESFSRNTLYPAYFFAQKIVLDSFQNAIMDTIQLVHYQAQYLIPAEDIKVIYENTLDTDEIRTYCQYVKFAVVSTKVRESSSSESLSKTSVPQSFENLLKITC